MSEPMTRERLAAELTYVRCRAPGLHNLNVERVLAEFDRLTTALARAEAERDEARMRQVLAERGADAAEARARAARVPPNLPDAEGGPKVGDVG